MVPLLKVNLPEIRFDNVGFADAVGFVSRLTGAPIEVNWSAAKFFGVYDATPVTFEARNIRVGELLTKLLRFVCGGLPWLEYEVNGGKIIVAAFDTVAQVREDYPEPTAHLLN